MLTKPIAQLVLLVGSLTAAVAFAQADAKPTTAGKTRLTLGFALSENDAGRVAVGPVHAGSPADAAGLRPGDVILKADDKTVVSSAGLSKHLHAKKPGEVVVLTVERGGDTRHIRLHTVHKQVVDSHPTSHGQEAGMFGMFAIEDGKGHVVVSRVTSQSPAADAGLEKGDVILSVDSFIPGSLEDLSKHMQELARTGNGGEELSIAITREDRSETLRLVVPKAGARSGAAAKPASAAPVAVARLLPVDTNQSNGTVVFITFLDEGDTTHVRVSGSGLAAGTYRLAVHEYGDCGDLANDSAGNIYPSASSAASSRAESPGDLGVLEARDDGTILNQSNIKGLRLSGPSSVLGRAVLLSPSGRGGSAIAAGVIGIGNPQRIDDVLQRAGTSVPGKPMSSSIKGTSGSRAVR